MKSSGKLNNIFTSIAGIFLLIEGIWGFNSEIVFGIFTTNIFHAVIHIILGIVGLVLAWAGITKGFNLFLGLLLIIVGVMRFIPGADQLVIDLFNVNKPVAWLNIGIGAVALIIVLSSKKR